ncbi:L-serine ammonia-lyase, iron-sulfur-dependent, subunit alpha [Desulfotomaculum sp. 1211_IL3151]|uniref:L-serine ammonia-lyase, iron-sulfur-dependent, subunit alpha n=1 Tax=Desulfotomaculum sp. 1211_IL3151 TaxID=3084055 RepID=UPI002FDAB081
MKRQNPSIFNDIVGPTMVGPSSAHTCGPARIGFLSRQFIHGNLTKAVIEFAKNGAYTDMYKGQHSDLGFVSGLLGFRPEDPRLKQAFQIAKDSGVDIQFVISDFEPIVPNIAKITMTSDQDEVVVIYSDSMGGGTVKLLQVDGFDISVVGDCYELIIHIHSANTKELENIKNTVASKFINNEGITLSTVNNKSLFNIKLRKDVEPSMMDFIKNIDNVTDVKLITPILVVPSNRNTKVPFSSAAELLEISKRDNKELWELAVAYECVRSGWRHKEVMDYMKYTIETMESSVKEALKGNIDMNGIIKPTAGKIKKTCDEGNTWLDMGVLDAAVPWAMATMEYSSAMGVVICAPTGGSAGVFPGAILGVANKLGLSMEEKTKAMFTAAIVGIAMSKDSDFSAELYGCQVEPGAASAMAAAALVYLMGGSVKQSLDAASCGIQNILGTICDPVAGLVQVPCISRNAMSVANSVVCANIVMGGYDPLIPLDEAAETLFRVGKQLPSELRCTCKGGLCITPTGSRLAKEQEERDNVRYEIIN